MKRALKRSPLERPLLAVKRDYQIAFLMEAGLQPHHHLLDIWVPSAS